MSKQASRAGSRPRSLTHSELQNVAAEFERLGRQLEGAADTLRAAPENPLVIDDMRMALSQAGRCLLRVMHHGAIDGPTRMPPWLSWSLRQSSGRRPRFCGLRSFTIYSGGRRKVSELIKLLMVSQSVASATPYCALPDGHVRFRHRQVFLESVAGWLGHRCNPRVGLHLPLAKAEFASDKTTDGSTEATQSVAITFDWDDQSKASTKSLFLEIGRAASAVCRHLTNHLRAIHQQTGIADTAIPGSSTWLASAGASASLWRLAAAEWRRHVVVVPAMHGRPARAILDLRHLVPPPVDGIAYESCEIETDPSPSARALLRLANDPGAELFERIALDLADATAALASALEAASIDSTPALELAQGIRRSARLPLASQEAMIRTVALQVDRLAARTKVAEVMPQEAPHPRGQPSAPESTGSEAVFARTGESTWFVRFGGAQASVVDSKGMGYLHRLLSTPNAPIHSWTLATGSAPPPSAPDPMLDPDALPSIRAKILALEDEMANCTDLDHRIELEHAIDEHRKHLRAATQGVGRTRVSRASRDDPERMRETVGKALKRAFNRLKRECPPLYAHLHSTVMNPAGLCPEYSCPDPQRPKWVLTVDAAPTT